ncbi:MAG TPA: AMP-binding protein [Candidatus Dormibacteraeota bacterium]|nr:AMP-binding protein [Candidatus Dormibacteraeota bacterium]
MTEPLTVPALLAARAAIEPDRTALLLDDGRSLTFGEWLERSDAIARGLLARGVERGDRIALRFADADWIDFAVAYLGVQKAAAAAVPLSTRLAPAETRDLLEQCAVAGVVHGADADPPDGHGAWTATPAEIAFAGTGPAAVEVRAADLAQILATSGTTGRPKGVCASHANLTYGFTAAPRRRPLAHSDRFLHAFPIGTNAAQTMLINALTARPAAVVAAGFEPDRFCALIEAHRIGTVFVVPATAIALLNARAHERHDVSSVLLLGSTAAPLPPVVGTALTAAFPNATIVNYYTSTEAAPAQTTMVFDPDRPSSVGRATYEDELMVADEGRRLGPNEVGEVWLRSRAAPRSYYADPEASARVFAPGWVRMGDVGYLDEDGYLYLVDREADAIKTGAFKVSTLQIENALYEHPAVAEAAVVGVPHAVMGTMVAAAVVLRQPVPLEGLRAFLGERLARHELPTRLEVVDALPHNDAGKVLKREVRALLAAPRRSPGRPLRTQAEVRLGRAWRRVLGAGAVAADDDFFALGGDSLRATQLAAVVGEAFGVSVPASLAFEASILADQAVRVEALLSGTPLPNPVPHGDRELLSAQQESFLGWMAEGGDGRHPGAVGTAIRIRDELDHDLLRRVLNEVVRRHEALRTVIRDGRGVLLDDCPPEFASMEAASEGEAAALLREARGRPFDAGEGPRLRAAAVRLGLRDHALALVAAHLMFDGWSMGVLLRELGLLYSAFRLGRPSPLPPLPLQAPDLFAWARRQWPRTREWWRRTLDGAPTAIDPFPGRLPADRFTRASVPFHIDAGAANRLRGAARAQAATPFMVAAACWSAVLTAWSGMADLVLMTPVPGRTRPDFEALIGCLVQSLLPRVDTGGDPPFTELLARVRTSTLTALDNQFYPYEAFRVRFPHAAWVRYESWGGPAHFPGLESEPFELPREIVPEEWHIEGGDRTVPELSLSERPDGSLSGWLVYNVYAFEQATIERLAEAFLRFSRRAIDQPALKLSELSR